MNNCPEGREELDYCLPSELEDEENDHEDVEPDYDEPDWDFYEQERKLDAMSDRWYKWMYGPEG